MGPRLKMGTIVADFLEATLRMSKTGIEVMYVGTDDSRTDQDHYIAYGAVMGLRPEWEIFERRWNAMLDEVEVSHLGTSDAMNWSNQFAQKKDEWGARCEARRDELLLRGANLIRDTLDVVSTAVRFEDFPPGSNQAQSHRRFSFTFLLLKVFAHAPDESVVSLMCDDDPAVAKDFIDLLAQFKKNQPPFVKRISGLCFVDDEHTAQAQAADMVAYVRRRHKEGRHNPLYPVLFDGTEEAKDDIVVTFTPKRLR